MSFAELLNQETFSHQDLVTMLNASGDDRKLLFSKASTIKKETIGNKVYFRGLVEYSNRCGKNCYYCGVRLGNKKVSRYTMTDEEVLEAS